ncbi:Hypothetical protein Cul210932_1846 [Corynebacterium ulcerans]|nr:Hypothetical protein Cul210932_1846 [Corynebacterium ulcerans]ALD95563.1 Hypothetical protein Cul131001_1878 [Corynebacterium ulcerans]
MGTTSAYAEKSGFTSFPLVDSRNYLRIRGEKKNTHIFSAFATELPPHTRRKVSLSPSLKTLNGTTSAYAEKSRDRISNLIPILELPPHTRRKASVPAYRTNENGTTSAYAEKSCLQTRFSQLLWNYLRIRGEKRAPHRIRFPTQELPPHTRRKALSHLSTLIWIGTTSAYAEKSVGI